MQNNSLICTIENGFGVKGKDLTSGQTEPKGTHQSRKHIFVCIERKSTLLRVSCGRDEGTENKKSTRGYNFTLCPIHPHFWQPPNFACEVGLWTQSNIPNVRWIGSWVSVPWGPKMTLFRWLGTSPLQVYALTCYTVKNKITFHGSDYLEISQQCSSGTHRTHAPPRALGGSSIPVSDY